MWEFEYLHTDQLQLQMRTGIFSYDYIDTVQKLQESHLLTIEKFYNKLNEALIIQSDHEHAIKIWNSFNFQSILYYMELYLKTDILLLTNIFENFSLLIHFPRL